MELRKLGNKIELCMSKGEEAILLSAQSVCEQIKEYVVESGVQHPEAVSSAQWAHSITDRIGGLLSSGRILAIQPDPFPNAAG